MDTLTSPPVADVLTKLFTAARVADGPLHGEWSDALQDDGEAVARFIAREAHDYRGVYREFAGNYLNVSAEFGRFLYVCARARCARHIVEFGTSFGISTIYLAAAVRDGQGGRLVSTELEPTKAVRARRSLVDAGLANAVDDAGDYLTYVRNPSNGYRSLPLPFEPGRSNEMSVYTA